jgi:hypothetical protein
MLATTDAGTSNCRDCPYLVPQDLRLELNSSLGSEEIVDSFFSISSASKRSRSAVPRSKQSREISRTRFANPPLRIFSMSFRLCILPHRRKKPAKAKGSNQTADFRLRDFSLRPCPKCMASRAEHAFPAPRRLKRSMGYSLTRLFQNIPPVFSDMVGTLRQPSRTSDEMCRQRRNTPLPSPAPQWGRAHSCVRHASRMLSDVAANSVVRAHIGSGSISLGSEILCLRLAQAGVWGFPPAPNSDLSEFGTYKLGRSREHPDSARGTVRQGGVFSPTFPSLFRLSAARLRMR